MKIPMTFAYTEEVIPRRCRKPRPVKYTDGSIELEIVETTDRWAPLAILARKPGGTTTPYRLQGNRLWKPVEDSLPGVIGPVTRSRFIEHAALYLEQAAQHYPTETRDDTIAKLKKAARSFLVVDDRVYRKCGEPRYVVMTFGLGHNHGNTVLLDDEGFNEHISRDRYFNIMQQDMAVEYATLLATERGDLKSLPIVPQTEFTVLLPQAVKLPRRLRLPCA